MEKQIKKDRNSNILQRNLITFIFLIVFICLTIIELLFHCLLNTSYISCKLTSVFPYDVISALIPTIIATIGISLGNPNTKIYGLTRNEWLTAKRKYMKLLEFKNYLFISIIIFASYFLYSGFNLHIASIITTIISISLTITICIEEVPFLIQDKTLIKKDLKELYGLAFNKDDENNKVEQELLRTALFNFFIEEGIDKFQELFNDNFGDVLYDALEPLNVFLFNGNKIKEDSLKDFNFEYKGINLKDSYKNICNSLSILFGEKYKNEKFLSNYFFMYRIGQTISLLNKYGEIINDSYLSRHVFCSFFGFGLYFKQEEIPYIYKYSNYLLTITLPERKKWFFDDLLDSSSFTKFYDNKNESYLLFVSMYLYYVYCYDKTRKEFVEIIINEKRNGVNNGYLTFKTMILNSLNVSNFDLAVKQLPFLLKCYKSLEHSHYDYYMNDPHFFGGAYTTNFNEYRIIRWYFEFINNAYRSKAEFNKFKEMFESLIEEDKESVVDVYEDYDNFKTLSEISYSELYEFDFNELQDDFKDQLNAYFNDFKKKQIENIENTDTNIEELKNKVKESLKEIHSECFKEELNKSDITNEYYSTYNTSFNNTKLDTLPLSIKNNLIYKAYELIDIAIDNKIKSNNSLNTYNIDKIKTDLIDKNPNDLYLMSNIYDYEKVFKKHHCDINYNNLHEGILSLSNSIIYKKDSLLFDIEIDESSIRKSEVTDLDIENIINNQYKLINGKYRYEYFKENKYHYVFITREELQERLKYVYESLSFKFKISFKFDWNNIYRFVSIEKDK